MTLKLRQFFDQVTSIIFPRVCYQCHNVQNDSVVLCKYCLESFFCLWQLDRDLILLAETKELKSLSQKEPRMIEALFLKALLELESPPFQIVSVFEEFKGFKILPELFDASMFSFDADYRHKQVIVIGLDAKDYEFFSTYLSLSGALCLKGVFLYKTAKSI